MQVEKGGGATKSAYSRNEEIRGPSLEKKQDLHGDRGSAAGKKGRSDRRGAARFYRR